MTRARDVANIDGLLTTTGDTFYASAAATPARLGVGSTGQVLTVSGGVPAWATASSGGMTLLETGSLTGASVTTGSLSQSYNSLRIVLRDFVTNNDGRVWLRVNGVSAANSYSTYMNSGYATVTFNADYMGLTVDIDNTVTKNLIVADIPDYSNATTYKMINSNAVYVDATTTTSLGYLVAAASAVKATTAISTLTFLMTGGTSWTGGTYYVYGVK